LQLEIVAKFENKLLKRTEYIFKILHDGKGTPKREEVKEAIASKLGVEKELVVIRKMRTPFGVNETLVDSVIYWDKNTLMEVEPKYILKRNKIIE